MVGAEDFSDPLVARIVAFLRGVGFTVEPAVLDQATLLPGVTVAGGVLQVDAARLAWPGDLLHEAGHLALGEPGADGVSDDPGEEMGAIAWSFAAALAMDLDAAVLFHAGGYKGEARALIENFTQGGYVGAPILAWRGLTHEPGRAPPDGPPAYPHMLAWRRV
ncbi:hypothetical protein [Caulobacter sp. LARHSG274]